MGIRKDLGLVGVDLRDLHLDPHWVLATKAFKVVLWNISKVVHGLNEELKKRLTGQKVE
ncbi:conserved hypothetical protein [Ricinus communis]|uniref:Uncharacterized protein n=1 Tax=Ricinus communis TaxID=3988 RepID=B9RFX7_RICCO|nr:conserved hypothetical protein [Ricinus communis]